MTTRWERLFDDLEAQAEQEERAAMGAEIAERTRHEVSRLRLADRFRAAHGREVTLRLLGAGTVRGIVRSAGRHWVLLARGAGAESVVPFAAMLGVTGLGPRTASPDQAGAVHARLKLGYLLRGLARDRAEVVATLVDGGVATGTIDRVGADFFELAQHELGVPRRGEMTTSVQVVPLTAVALLTRGP